MQTLKLKLWRGSTVHEQIVFEKVADDLLMLTIYFGTEGSDDVPKYYRLLGDQANPPLEIGIHQNKGSIQFITAFIENVNLSKESKPFTIMQEETGEVIFEDFFNEKNFIDIDGQYYFLLFNNTLYCLFDTTHNNPKLVLNQRTGFIFNETNCLIGFCVNALQKEESELLGILEK